MNFIEQKYTISFKKPGHYFSLKYPYSSPFGLVLIMQHRLYWLNIGGIR